jgi:thioredoxin 1
MARPKLVELGSSKCASCKAMHEELGELRRECPDGLEIEIIDVFRDEAKAKPYDVSVIPTQVFLDKDGKEIDRHIGFLARAETRERFAKTGRTHHQDPREELR